MVYSFDFEGVKDRRDISFELHVDDGSDDLNRLWVYLRNLSLFERSSLSSAEGIEESSP